MLRGFRQACCVWGLLALVGVPGLHAVEDSGAVTVSGVIEIDRGRLPARLRVLATPVRGGEPRTVDVQEGGTFEIADLSPGIWRFELLLANGSLFAEAGSREVVLGPGRQSMTLVVQRGRIDPPARSFSEWPRRRQVLVVVAGLAAAATLCAAADCFEDDSASPSSP